MSKPQLKTKKRINLYIDGTNLFAGQNELFGPKKFLPFKTLIKEIRKIFPVNKIYFYASYMAPANFKTPEHKKLAGLEAQFYRQVRATLNLTFFKGHRSPTSGKEKGVDVHLAVDMVKHAFRGEYDEAVIMTGDADLIYPLLIAKELDTPVHAIFLPNRFSLEMAYRADSATVLNYGNKFSFKREKLPRYLKIVSIKKPRM